jgi:hypothetical protein
MGFPPLRRQSGSVGLKFPPPNDALSFLPTEVDDAANLQRTDRQVLRWS